MRDKKSNKKFCCPIAFIVSNWAMLLAREVSLLLGDGRSDSDVRQIGLMNLTTCVAWYLQLSYSSRLSNWGLSSFSVPHLSYRWPLRWTSTVSLHDSRKDGTEFPAGSLHATLEQWPETWIEGEHICFEMLRISWPPNIEWHQRTSTWRYFFPPSTQYLHCS